MKIKDYLKLHDLSQKGFADSIGVSEVHVCNILKGRKSPSLPLAKKIQEVTNGNVGLNDLFNPEAPSRLNKKRKKVK